MALKWRHAGQACITANRVYVQKSIYEKFSNLLISKTKSLKIGHGSISSTTLGPVTTSRSLEKAESQVTDALSHGGKLLLGSGSRKKDTEGYFFEPTVIGDANREMLIAREETFAPVLALFAFETEEEVVRLANDTSMGLASYFFTKDVDRTWRLFENLEAGMIGINTGESSSDFWGCREGFCKELTMMFVGNSSAAESPFGGIKESGYGKESGKDVAVNEYLITKTGTFTLDGQY
jgi:succinate-semialdehyde dehydrogenase/glutarate-semialdehyde dehydrogenase